MAREHARFASIKSRKMLTVKNRGKKSAERKADEAKTVVDLSKPKYFGEYSIEEVLLKRRSIRNFRDEPLQLKDVSQLLWAAQGLTDKEGKRTAPSAGAIYPLSIYLAAANVNELSPGVYRYDPVTHRLALIEEGDKRKLLYTAALMQGALRHCAAILVFTADYTPVIIKYFEKAKRYVYMEVGHAAQNVFLQAVSLDLGTVPMGAFLNGAVKKILRLPKNEEPLYLMPVGKI